MSPKRREAVFCTPPLAANWPGGATCFADGTFNEISLGLSNLSALIPFPLTLERAVVSDDQPPTQWHKQG